MQDVYRRYLTVYGVCRRHLTVMSVNCDVCRCHLTVCDVCDVCRCHLTVMSVSVICDISRCHLTVCDVCRCLLAVMSVDDISLGYVCMPARCPPKCHPTRLFLNIALFRCLRVCRLRYNGIASEVGAPPSFLSSFTPLLPVAT